MQPPVGAPTRAVFWGWHSDSAVAAVERLQREGRLSVKAWFGNAPACTQRLNPFLHQFRLPPAPAYAALRQPLRDDELVAFFDMYSRVSRSRGMSVQELQHTAYCYYHHFAELLAREQVQLVAFSSPPHFGVDYLLYLAAQRHGAQTVVCYQTLFPNRFFCVQRLEDFGRFDDPLPEPLPQRLTIARRHEKELFYMRSIAPRPERPYASLLNDVRRNLLRASSKPMSLAGIVEKFRETRAWNREYPRHAQEEIPAGTPYVYFPLQLQPEMTTSTLGAGYSDQLTAMECLSRLIPDDWLILAKENPKQTHRQRGESFFRRLAATPKLRYLSKKVNTYQLMEGARFVATVTGTAAWEAVSGGKPALAFGRPWYLRLPGVATYRPDMTLSEITDQCFTHEQLEDALNELMSHSLPGVIDPQYRQIVPDYRETANVEHLEDCLVRVLEGRMFRPAVG